MNNSDFEQTSQRIIDGLRLACKCDNCLYSYARDGLNPEFDPFSSNDELFTALLDLAKLLHSLQAFSDDWRECLGLAAIQLGLTGSSLHYHDIAIGVMGRVLHRFWPEEDGYSSLSDAIAEDSNGFRQILERQSNSEYCRYNEDALKITQDWSDLFANVERERIIAMKLYRETDSKQGASNRSNRSHGKPGRPTDPTLQLFQSWVFDKWQRAKDNKMRKKDFAEDLARSTRHDLINQLGLAEGEALMPHLEEYKQSTDRAAEVAKHIDTESRRRKRLRAD